MKNFLNLPIEKQTTVINAALFCFGTNGYKKASVSDIAGAAGISKAMVFHYFGTKKELYLYLIDFCGTTLMNEVNSKSDAHVTDFFERIKLAADIEISAMKQHPAMMSFINSALYETDEDVRADIKAILPKGDDFRNGFVLTGVDTGKFKEGVDPGLVLKMLTWITEGYLSEQPNIAALDMEMMGDELEACLNLLRNNLYREEHL